MSYKSEIQPLGEWFQSLPKGGVCVDLEMHLEVLPPPPGRLVLWSGMPANIRRDLRRDLVWRCRIVLQSALDILQVFGREHEQYLTQCAARAVRSLRRSRRAGGWQRIPVGREAQSDMPVPCSVVDVAADLSFAKVCEESVILQASTAEVSWPNVVYPH
ncbi:hypothetical protein [Prosthecobacter sp.]|uniref:hypothetical protein n=1 Tax=Prosthecobacter sp. TaxID=1965333 RepID=UPI002AC9ED28|nr:hypothetical protein [Prosthecobacter sp.]